MNNAGADIRSLEESYTLLEQRLVKQLADLDSGKLSALTDENGPAIEELIRRSEASVSRLLHNLESSGRNAAAGDESRSPAVQLGARCLNLLALIERNAEGFRRARSEASTALRDLRTGGRFLHSMRAYEGRQPKFIDAHQ